MHNTPRGVGLSLSSDGGMWGMKKQRFRQLHWSRESDGWNSTFKGAALQNQNIDKHFVTPSWWKVPKWFVSAVCHGFVKPGSKRRSLEPLVSIHVRQYEQLKKKKSSMYRVQSWHLISESLLMWGSLRSANMTKLGELIVSGICAAFALVTMRSECRARRREHKGRWERPRSVSKMTTHQPQSDTDHWLPH